VKGEEKKKVSGLGKFAPTPKRNSLSIEEKGGKGGTPVCVVGSTPRENRDGGGGECAGGRRELPKTKSHESQRSDKLIRKASIGGERYCGGWTGGKKIGEKD